MTRRGLGLTTTPCQLGARDRPRIPALEVLQELGLPALILLQDVVDLGNLKKSAVLHSVPSSLAVV
jgi:hypothetical protein